MSPADSCFRTCESLVAPRPISTPRRLIRHAEEHCSSAPRDADGSDGPDDDEKQDSNLAAPNSRRNVSSPSQATTKDNDSKKLPVVCGNRDEYMRHLINTYPGFYSAAGQAQAWLDSILTIRKQSHRIATDDICLAGSDLHHLQREWGVQDFEGLGVARSNAMLIVSDMMDAVHVNISLLRLLPPFLAFC
ncbi:hypothetical protein ColLi_11468 [Colletotrichum liriopes]|uniref:Uncharacterized protein n=1 Tax=Colletotrichum liriopes TaxID=708192 RepID=A0AA37LX25_9PEZI|nr:hypothetical protein ColLi_11468 [Colletotrichum liriopes]